jgi:CheY-like chemotaxis protein
MPVMGGLEALTLIREEEHNHGRERALKVMIATASDDDDSISAARPRWPASTSYPQIHPVISPSPEDFLNNS